MPFDRDRLSQLLRGLRQSLPVALVRRFVEADLLTHAAALSFYALLSLAPLLVLLLWLAASLYPSAQGELVRQVGDLAGSEAREVVATVVANAERRPDVGSLAGLWSTALLFVGATVVFARLQTALNLVFRSDARKLPGLRAWLRKRVLSFGVVLALGFLLIVSMTLSTLLQVTFAWLPDILPVLGNLSSLGLYTLAFALLYHYLPDRRVRWRQAFLGGLVTSALFVLGRWAIGMYLDEAAPGSAYGAMGTLVLLLVWMYYAAAVFFIGALLTAVIDERAAQAGAGHRTID
jgi:membrane protein